jgi:hypothetical protein
VVTIMPNAIPSAETLVPRKSTPASPGPASARAVSTSGACEEASSGSALTQASTSRT